VLKVREAGRVVNVHALIATGVNAEGYREILGIDVTTAEDGAGWLTFLRSLTARGLSGVRLVTSDAHAGLLSAIGATLPGASWQRCRTHYADVRIMPIWVVSALVVGPGGCWSRHNRALGRATLSFSVHYEKEASWEVRIGSG
jgi:Transposase, Mutator family